MDLEWLGLPDAAYLIRVTTRLGAAAALGGFIGAERERLGKAAGLRTHMTVALGAATFVLVVMESGAQPGELSRVIQGIAAGIGFIGAGTILKKSDSEDIQGLTTAATIWLTAGVGAAAGAGQGWMGLICVAGAWLTLTLLGRASRWLNPDER